MCFELRLYSIVLIVGFCSIYIIIQKCLFLAVSFKRPIHFLSFPGTLLTKAAKPSRHCL